MIILAVEDALGKALGERLLRHEGFSVKTVLGMKGNGWLQQNGARLNQAAKHMSILMLTDSDGKKPTNVMNTICSQPHASRFIVSVCVTEAESWVLADAHGFGAWLGGGIMKIPNQPDDIPNAKEFLVNLARKYGKRTMKKGLVPKKGSTAAVGPQYNPLLTQFVDDKWAIPAASKTSPSLRRCLKSIAGFPA